MKIFQLGLLGSRALQSIQGEFKIRIDNRKSILQEAELIKLGIIHHYLRVSCNIRQTLFLLCFLCSVAQRLLYQFQHNSNTYLHFLSGKADQCTWKIVTATPYMIIHFLYCLNVWYYFFKHVYIFVTFTNQKNCLMYSREAHYNPRFIHINNFQKKKEWKGNQRKSFKTIFMKLVRKATLKMVGLGYK